MATTRDIAKLLPTHLGVDVTPHAARLVRERVLPRPGRPVDDYEAASLLLAVAGASNPAQSIEVLEQLASAPLYSILRPRSVTGLDIPVWDPATPENYELAPASATDLIILALQGGVNITWGAIDAGGDRAVFEVSIGSGNPVHLRVNYAAPKHCRSAGHTGLVRVTKFFGDVVTSLASAMRPEARNADTRPVSLELH